MADRGSAAAITTATPGPTSDGAFIHPDGFMGQVLPADGRSLSYTAPPPLAEAFANAPASTYLNITQQLTAIVYGPWGKRG